MLLLMMNSKMPTLLPAPRPLTLSNECPTFFRYIGHDDEEDTMDSSNSSTVQPTSNLIAPDSLKRHHNNANPTSTTTSVRFSLDSEPRSSENQDSNQENTPLGKTNL